MRAKRVVQGSTYLRSNEMHASVFWETSLVTGWKASTGSLGEIDPRENRTYCFPNIFVKNVGLKTYTILSTNLLQEI
jgi:hypothetical protein